MASHALSASARQLAVPSTSALALRGSRSAIQSRRAPLPSASLCPFAPASKQAPSLQCAGLRAPPLLGHQLQAHQFQAQQARRGSVLVSPASQPWRGLAGAARAAVSAPAEAPPQVSTQALPWQWQPAGSADPIPINAVSFSAPNGASPAPGSPAVLLLPAPSDVSTVDEWTGVAARLLQGPQVAGSRVLSVDWPGFGASGCPPLLYTADMLEDFLVAYVESLFPGQSGTTLPLVIVGAGHAATIALRAIARGRITPAGLTGVAPTWGGPLPIVFGNEDKMTFRYGILRSLLRAPGVGWAMYRYLTSPKSIRMQYMMHVYADPDNIRAGLVDDRCALTQREGGRFAPSSFVTGLLDPVKDREAFLQLFQKAEERGVPVGVIVSTKSPKRSRREMESLEGAPGVASYVTVPGALLAHEEYPEKAAQEVLAFIGSEGVKMRLA